MGGRKRCRAVEDVTATTEAHVLVVYQWHDLYAFVAFLAFPRISNLHIQKALRILVNFSWIRCASLQKTQYIMSLLPYLISLVSEQNLPAADAEAAMQIILRGEASHPQIAAFLIALKMKGETVDELVGFARAMRQMAVPVDAGLCGRILLDTFGTGGDGCTTLNISTALAFVVAGPRAYVAN